MFIKKMKCPRCGKTAEMNVVDGEIIVSCKARTPCGYINRRPAQKQ